MVYVIRSTSFRLLNDKVSSLIENIPDRKYFSLDVDELEDVIIDASYVGLFNDDRAIVVREVNYFGGKPKYEEQVSMGDISSTYSLMRRGIYLDSSITLILICNNLNKTKDTAKELLKKTEFIDLYIKDEEIDTYINDYISKINVTIEPKALVKLKENTVNNIDLLFNEIDKLALITNNITWKVVNEFGSSYIIPKGVGEETDYNDITFKFTDAIANKKFKDAFAYFDKIVERGDDMYALIGLINGQFSNIYLVKEAVNEGLSDETIANELGFKSGRVYILKRIGNLYTLDELRDIIINLSNIDIKIKLGYDPVNGLKEFILSI